MACSAVYDLFSAANHMINKSEQYLSKKRVNNNKTCTSTQICTSHKTKLYDLTIKHCHHENNFVIFSCV